MTTPEEATNRAGGSPVERGVRPPLPKRDDADALMKRCQIGVGGRHALDNAHSIMAECYGTLGRQQIEIERLRAALHEIAEEWAGAECGEPVHAQEAYAIGLAKRMYALAAAALRPNARLSGRQQP